MSRAALALFVLLASLAHGSTALAVGCRQSPRLSLARELASELLYQEAQSVLAEALDDSNLCYWDVLSLRALRGYLAAALSDEAAAQREFQIESSLWQPKYGPQELWPADLPASVRRIREEAHRTAPRMVLRAEPTQRAKGELGAWKVTVEDPFKLGAELRVTHGTREDMPVYEQTYVPLTDRLAIPSQGTADLASASLMLLDAHRNELMYVSLPIPWKKAAREGEEPPPPGDAPAGRVTIDTTPPATIYYEGRWVGETPVVGLELPIGTQQIKAVAIETKSEKVVPIKVEPQKTLRYRFRLP